jgi:transcriptional antiterminator RfaH
MGTTEKKEGGGVQKLENTDYLKGDWYVIRTKPSGESRAKLNLERQYYQVYLPQLCRVVEKSGHWQPVTTPMFPGYLFVGPFDSQRSLSPVNNTPGVSHIVRFGNVPATVSAAILNSIRRLEQEQTQTGDADTFLPGAKVRFDRGPLCGRQGIVSRSASGRVDVLLSMLGRDVAIAATPDLLRTLS